MNGPQQETLFKQTGLAHHDDDATTENWDDDIPQESVMGTNT